MPSDRDRTPASDPRHVGAGVADPDTVARRGRAVAVVAMLGCTTAYGGGLVMSKAALSMEAGLPPLLLLLVQLIASVAFLAVLALAATLVRARRRGRTPAASTGPRRTRGWRGLLAGWPGVVEPGLSYIALVVGLGLTTAGNASVVGSTEPVLTAAGAWLVFREKLTLRVVLLMGVALAGVLLVTGDTLRSRGPTGVVGDGLVLLAVVLAVVYALISARTVRRLSPLVLTLLQHAWATVFLAVVVLVAAAATAIGRLDADWAQVTPTTAPTLGVWGFAALSGIVNYSVPFWLYLVAIRSLPIGVAAQFLALVPVFGMLGGAVLLGEPVGLVQAGGAALVVVAVLLISRSVLGTRHGTRSGRRPPTAVSTDSADNGRPSPTRATR